LNNKGTKLESGAGLVTFTHCCVVFEVPLDLARTQIPVNMRIPVFRNTAKRHSEHIGDLGNAAEHMNDSGGQKGT
jgi:hypothetical protein